MVVSSTNEEAEIQKCLPHAAEERPILILDPGLGEAEVFIHSVHSVLSAPNSCELVHHSFISDSAVISPPCYVKLSIVLVGGGTQPSG